jgi:replicative DNA helicase
VTRPDSVAGELTLIAALLAGAADVLPQLEPEDFTTVLGRDVHAIASELQRSGKEVNLLTIDEVYARRQSYPGFAALQQTLSDSPSASLRFAAVNAVKRGRAMREAKAFDPSRYEPEELPLKFVEHANRIRDMLNFDAGSMVDVLAELRRDVPKVPTGYPRLDELLGGGIERGAVFTLGGVPGDGKTAMATHMTAMALEAGRKVHFVTLEMTRPALTRRVMKAYWGRTGAELEGQLEAALQMAGDLSVTNTLVRLPDVLASMSRHADSDLVVVDFVQRVRNPGLRDNRVAETESVSGAIANFAREFEVPVLLLSQLNRDYKSDKAEPPQMYHMKGSGSIEADSHIVALLHNPNAKEEQNRSVSVKQGGPTRDEERVLYIRKNRNGPVGQVRFVFDKPRSMFREDVFYSD